MEMQIGWFGIGVFLLVGFGMGYMIGTFKESLWYAKHNLDVRKFYHDIYRNMSENINELQDELRKGKKFNQPMEKVKKQ